MADIVKIGWAKRSIAMDGPVPITGQFHIRVSFGSYTDVLASALVLENGEDSVIFVSADMVSIMPGLVIRVQEILREQSPEIPADKILMNATHTHAGPSAAFVEGDYPNDIKITPSSEVLEYLAKQISAAIQEAWNKRAEGSIAYGYGFAVTGHSRRVVYHDDVSKRMYGGAAGLFVNGHAKMYGATNDTMFEGYECGLDPFINLLYTFDKGGKLTGAIVNVPCPSQTGENTWMFHASFWHNVREKLTAKYGDIGVISQTAAAGDLSPRQLHYGQAELRRYRLKYPHLRTMMEKKPFRVPDSNKANESVASFSEYDLLEYCRAEDIAGRITDAFEEVLSWASQEKQEKIELKHRVEVLDLPRRMFPKEMVDAEKANYEELEKKEFSNDPAAPWDNLRNNSILTAQRRRCKGVLDRSLIQDTNPAIPTQVHVLQIGEVAFASNPFELFMSYMHRMQARSPFIQTFVVQLAGDPTNKGGRGYLATERATGNKGYSASPYCNQVSYEGGQILVDETLKILVDLKK